MDQQLGPLINLGAVGCVLAWFMFKAEPRLKGLEESIDRNTRALLLAIISIEGLSPGVKDQVNTLLKEVELSASNK